MAVSGTDWKCSIRLSAALAVPDFAVVHECLAEAGERGVEPGLLYELILQSYLFLGYPRAIEGLKRLYDVFPDFVPPSVEQIDSESSKEYKKRGETLCKVIYGENYERLRDTISRLSPDLDYWMVWEGYGKVLSREGVDPALRELCTVSALVVTGDLVQLHSHIRGALHTGASPDSIRVALSLVEDLASDSRFEQASALVDRILRKVPG